MPSFGLDLLLGWLLDGFEIDDDDSEQFLLNECRPVHWLLWHIGMKEIKTYILSEIKRKSRKKRFPERKELCGRGMGKRPFNCTYVYFVY